MSKDLFLKYLRKDLKPYVKESDCCEDIVELRKEIERLNKIIEIKNNRIQQLMNRTRSARIDKAIEYIDHCIFDYEENTMIGEDFKIIKNILKGSDKE